MDSATGKPAVVERHIPLGTAVGMGHDPSVSEFLPIAEALPRPDELLLKPPYHLIMRASHLEISIECSHSPTLQLLESYLKRWCRVNHNDTRSVSLALTVKVASC